MTVQPYDGRWLAKALAGFGKGLRPRLGGNQGEVRKQALYVQEPKRSVLVAEASQSEKLKTASPDLGVYTTVPNIYRAPSLDAHTHQWVTSAWF